MNIAHLVSRFLAWPLPATVCADPIASIQGRPHRSGTNLLNAHEAEQMIKHVLGGAEIAFTLTDDDVTRIRKVVEQQWLRRAETRGLKYGTKAYLKAELEFFVGAMAMAQVLVPGEDGRMSPVPPPSWTINVMIGRPIVDKHAKEEA